MTSKAVLQQILNDPYRSKSDKDAARAELDQQSGLVRERKELDKNASGLHRLAQHVDRLSTRLEKAEARLQALEAILPANYRPITEVRKGDIDVTNSPGPEAAENDPPTKPPVETVPQSKIPDEGGQTQGRPKNRYAVEGTRGSWGIKDSQTGFFVWPVQKLRKDADAFCKQLNKGQLEPEGELAPPSQRIGGHNANTAETTQQTVETAEGQIGQDDGPPPRAYETTEEKPAPAVRPDREKSTSKSTGRVPWYAK